MKNFLRCTLLYSLLVAIGSMAQAHSAFGNPQNVHGADAPAPARAAGACKLTVTAVDAAAPLPATRYHQIMDAPPTAELLKVRISATTAVKDLSVVALEYVPNDTEPLFRITALYSLYTLTPETPLLLGIAMPGSIPQRGIVYTDADGTRQLYSLVLSGEDDSIQLSKAVIYAGDAQKP